METPVFVTRIRYFILTLACVMMILSFNPCAAQVDFLVSPVVPAARGTVSVTKDKYNNYVMRIYVTSLSEAGRLTPPKNTYVVWMQTAQDSAKNIGQIRTSTSLLSKKLKAYFETKSVYKPLRIFITAEYDPILQYPGSQVILTTKKFNMPKE